MSKRHNDNDLLEAHTATVQAPMYPLEAPTDQAVSQGSS
mgnify:CR=1 FL=1